MWGYRWEGSKYIIVSKQNSKKIVIYSDLDKYFHPITDLEIVSVNFFSHKV